MVTSSELCHLIFKLDQSKIIKHGKQRFFVQKVIRTDLFLGELSVAQKLFVTRTRLDAPRCINIISLNFLSSHYVIFFCKLHTLKFDNKAQSMGFRHLKLHSDDHIIIAGVFHDVVLKRTRRKMIP